MDYNLYCVVDDNQLLGIYTGIVDALQVCRHRNISSNNIFIGHKNCDAKHIKKYLPSSPPPPSRTYPQTGESV